MVTWFVYQIFQAPVVVDLLGVRVLEIQVERKDKLQNMCDIAISSML